MASKSIQLTAGADRQSVLRAAQTALTERGYGWEPAGRDGARAYQGGRPIKPKRMTRRLLLGLTLTRDRLVLRRESSGWGFGPSLGFLLSARIDREFRRAGRAVHATLRSAGLAT
jgi:hypothetical protein